MSVWVSRERRVRGKLKLQTMTPRTRVKDNDEFAVYWLEGRAKHQVTIKIRGVDGKEIADQFAKKKEMELELERLGLAAQPTAIWADYRAHYESVVMSLLPPRTQKLYRESFNWFERQCKPTILDDLNKATFDAFRAELALQPGRAKGSKMSPATVNKHLRTVKIIIQNAVDDELIARMPKVQMMREPEKLPVDMLPEHFDAIYDACKVAIYPKRVNAVERRQYTPAEWWHAIMVLGVMTGMRLEEMLALYWINVDLDKGQITIDAINNKGRREANIPLHEAVILHLEPLRQFSEKVFDWQARKRDAKNRTALYRQWHKIQQAADIDICRQRHSHKDSDPCHFYGFHSLKMACGTQNATEMPQMALNAFMRHASPATTARFYRNATRAARKAMGSLFVPDSVKQQRG